MLALNFISLAVSVFISNYIMMYIIRLLPIKNKKIVQLVIISLADVGSIIGYIIPLFNIEIDVIYLLYTLGNIIGIGVAYVASLMLILENVSIFKSKRAREFERGINNKEGFSIPRYILSCICLGIAIVLYVYGAINLTHYTSKLLVTTIGVFIGGTIALVLAIYFFISGKPQHQKLSAENLLLIIFLPNECKLYQASLTKEFTMSDALKELETIYLLDEFGLIITPKHKYIVKGVKMDQQNINLLSKLPMEEYINHPFTNVIEQFSKYQRKKVILDDQNNIIKITNIK